MKMLLTLVISLMLIVTAGCKEGTETIVVAGDSWALFVCTYKSLDNALAKASVTGQSVNANCLSTTKASMRAESWHASKYHQATLEAIANPTVKVLYLSLGGNDILNHWNKNKTSAEERVIFETVQQHITDATSAYLNARPDLKILISGYDYPRFSDDNKIEAYREAYADMGSPTPAELNQFLNRFAESMTKFVDHKNVFYVQHHGLMQYYLGNGDADLKPFVTLSPEQISSADQPARFGGDDRLQTDEKGMLRIGPLTDAFHLSKFGFDKLAEHSVTQYLKTWLTSK